MTLKRKQLDYNLIYFISELICVFNVNGRQTRCKNVLFVAMLQSINWRCSAKWVCTVNISLVNLVRIGKVGIGGQVQWPTYFRWGSVSRNHHRHRREREHKRPVSNISLFSHITKQQVNNYVYISIFVIWVELQVNNNNWHPFAQWVTYWAPGLYHNGMLSLFYINIVIQYRLYYLKCFIEAFE